MNFAAQVELNARNDPDRPAILFEDERLSWRGLDRQTNQFANLLVERGFGVGDTLALYAPNVPAFVVAFYGAMKAGVVAMPLNTRFSGGEVGHLLSHVGHRGLVTLSRYDDLLETLDLHDVEHVLVAGDTQLSRDGVSVERFEDALDTQPETFETVPRRNDDHAFYMHTSGTTGRPKPVIAAHGGVRSHALGYLDRLGLTRHDVALNAIPIFHVGGLNLHLTMFTQLGAPEVLVDGWDVESALAAIERHDVTYTFLVAPMLYDMANDETGGAYDTSSLELVGVGGQNVPPAVVHRFEERYGARVLEAYGLTETMPAVLSNAPDDRRLGTAGTPIENSATLRVVDPEEPLTERSRGELGELVVTGDVVTPGYLDRPDANAESFVVDDDGTRWLRTGDIVRMDQDGYVSIEDRVDHMIISGGENVYPNEVEEALYEVPGVSEAVVVGEPHERFGERVVAVVVASDDDLTEDGVIEHLRDGSLAGYKRPRRVVFTDEIPRGGAGKIDRLAVEERFLD